MLLWNRFTIQANEYISLSFSGNRSLETLEDHFIWLQYLGKDTLAHQDFHLTESYRSAARRDFRSYKAYCEPDGILSQRNIRGQTEYSEADTIFSYILVAMFWH